MITKKNKKGNIYFGFAMGMFIFVFGVLFLPYILDVIDVSRVDLNCASPELISDGIKLTCLAISGVVPYYIWFFISTFIGYLIGSKS